MVTEWMATSPIWEADVGFKDFQLLTAAAAVFARDSGE